VHNHFKEIRLSRKKRHKSPRHKSEIAANVKSISVRQGFDFGVEIRGMLIADMSFIDLLKQAEIIACAYGTAPETSLETPLPQISLVGFNGEPLAKAFAEFGRWASSGDGDAIELTFIFLQDGGYLLLIERERTRAIWSLEGTNRIFSNILFGGTYIKKFDTRGPHLAQFRSHKERLLISPFLFGAVSIAKKNSDIPTLQDIQPIATVVPLLKFEAKFLDEHAINADSPYHPLLKLTKESAPSKNKRGLASPLPPPSIQRPVDFFRHRSKIIDRHFPVTVERIRANKYPALIGAIRERGIRDWQFEQAVCNLFLSESLCQGTRFYPTVPSEGFERIIAHAIHEREERSDTPEIDTLPLEDIVTQVTLDGVALLQAYGDKTSPSDLERLQRKLAELNLLERSNG
jgi:hypothetical protein